RSLTLSCLPCGVGFEWNGTASIEVTVVPELECGPKPTCSYGLTRSPCSCCGDDVCAKGPGEECDNAWGFIGTCSKGLECKVEILPIVNGMQSVIHNGVCVAVHPGTCPPSHKECTDALKGLSIHIPQICSEDAECRFYSKCCFDKCLDHHTCKPAQ
ncbi:unnamed protein product, partial [Meganyctiphanes norvegica]